MANDAPGSTIELRNLMLKRATNSAGRNPYLVIQVDPTLIQGHADITDERIIDFVGQMILVSTHTADETQQVRANLNAAP